MAQNGHTESSAFARPVPREPKSAAQLAHIQLHNRRREYLERNPSYFDNLEHELADPILYERLVKRFQDAAERDSEGKAKGYGRTLEADLVRGETRLADVDPSRANGDESAEPRKAAALDLPWDRETPSKEEGQELWHGFLEDRFVQGEDEDFDYELVDLNEDYDVVARKDAEDAWFDEEEPSWEADVEATEPEARRGETGVQDY